MADVAEDDDSFEASLAALETVVGRLEEGNLSLGATIDTFEQGMKLAERCRVLLDQAELRISQIETDGEPETLSINGDERVDDLRFPF